MNAALQEAERLRRQLKYERDGRATKAAAADTKWAEAVKDVERKYDELDASTDEDVAHLKARVVMLRTINNDIQQYLKTARDDEVRGEKQRTSEANREKVVAEKRVKELEAQVGRLQRGRGAVNERAAELAELSSKLKVEVQQSTYDNIYYESYCYYD